MPCAPVRHAGDLAEAGEDVEVQGSVAALAWSEAELGAGRLGDGGEAVAGPGGARLDADHAPAPEPRLPLPSTRFLSEPGDGEEVGVLGEGDAERAVGPRQPGPAAGEVAQIGHPGVRRSTRSPAAVSV